MKAHTEKITTNRYPFVMNFPSNCLKRLGNDIAA